MKTYDELLAERDDLAAQVEAIRQADREYKDSNISRYEFANKVMAVINSTPQQCLAEIKAEAGRAGFVAGYHKMHIEFVGSLASSEGAEFAANQYAAKVQQDEKGTWLKDSNVNGGKRQGGGK